MNTNIYGDFLICISVPLVNLIFKKLSRHYNFYETCILMFAVLNIVCRFVRLCHTFGLLFQNMANIVLEKVVKNLKN